MNTALRIVRATVLAAGFIACSAAPASAAVVYTVDEPQTVAENVVSADGGSKDGAAPLVLTGSNDFGGSFAVNEGSLIADFGQGLASTDNLVLGNATYGLASGDVFNWNAGTGGGEISIAGGATVYGFSAYLKDFSVVAGGNAATPLEIGTASSTGFNPTQFVLNDICATGTVTLKNPVVGKNSDDSMPTLRVRTDASAAVMEGGVSNVTFVKWGAGTLSMRGATNKLGRVYPREGTLIIAPPDGMDKCVVDLSSVYNATNTVGTTIISNAVMTSDSAWEWYGNNKVTLVNSSVTTTAGGWIPGVRSGPTGLGKGETGTLVLDGSSITLKASFAAGYYNGKYTCIGQVLLTNNSSIASNEIIGGRYGEMHQYGGRVSTSKNTAGSFRLAYHNGGYFNYHLHSGTVEMTSVNAGSTFTLGYEANQSATGRLYVYKGGSFIYRGATGGYIGHNTKNTGYMYVWGGSVTLTKSGANLWVGNLGNGTCEIKDGGVVDVNGNVIVVPASGTVTGRKGTLTVLTNGTLVARSVYSGCANDTATLNLDGGTIQVKSSSSAADFIYGLTSATVGAYGGTIDTGAKSVSVSQSFTSGGEPVSGAAFVKTGSGTLTLTGANSWTCPTCVPTVRLRWWPGRCRRRNFGLPAEPSILAASRTPFRHFPASAR